MCAWGYRLAVLLTSGMNVAMMESMIGVASDRSQESICSGRLQECVQALGSAEIASLYEWVANCPSKAYTPASAAPFHGSSSLESATFALFAELGLQTFTSLVDFVATCQITPESCMNSASPFNIISKHADAFQDQMKSIARDYASQSGVRSCVIQASRNLNADFMRFWRELPQCVDAAHVLQKTSVLVDAIGQRSRLLAHHLGMHAWLRTLAVPGQGSPMFVLHDDYWSWHEMLYTLVGNMVRNGMPQLVLAHVGFQLDDAQDGLLDTFQQLQYLGVITESDLQTNFQAYSVLQDRMKKHGSRGAVHQTSSLRAAEAIPLQALDIVLLHMNGSYEEVLHELQLWQTRVKPAGILAGHGFSPEFIDGVRAVCNLRFGTDIHVGIGGTFWWYVEPEE